MPAGDVVLCMSHNHDETVTQVLFFDLGRLIARDAENFAVAGTPAKVISMTDERDKRSGGALLKMMVAEAINEHLAKHFIEERDRLQANLDSMHATVSSLSEIVKDYHATERDRLRDHMEAMRRVDAEIPQLKEMYEARYVELQGQVRRLIKQVGETPNLDLAAHLRVLVGEQTP